MNQQLNLTEEELIIHVLAVKSIKLSPLPIQPVNVTLDPELKETQHC